MQETRVISRTDLARRARQVVDQVRRGQTLIVQSYGEEQAALIDIIDYRLLRAVAAYQTLPPQLNPLHDRALAPRGLEDEEVQKVRAQAAGNTQALWNLVIASYLDGDISLGRAAQLLAISRFAVMERFTRFGIPLHLGPTSIQEASSEFEALRDEG